MIKNSQIIQLYIELTEIRDKLNDHLLHLGEVVDRIHIEERQPTLRSFIDTEVQGDDNA